MRNSMARHEETLGRLIVPALFIAALLFPPVVAQAQAKKQKQRRAIIYSNQAYSITREGKLIPKPGFKSVRLASGRMVVYNTKNWLFTRDEGRTIFTSIGSAFCEPACPAGSTCVNKVCQPTLPCGGACPPGTICNNNVCVPLALCTPACLPEQICEQGKCVGTGGGDDGETRCDPECKDGEICSCGGAQCECVPAAGGIKSIKILM